MAESSFLNPARLVVAAGIHEGHRVADLGAGSGFFTRAAARRSAPGVVWAVDQQADLLPRIATIAKAEGLHNVEVMRGNIEQVGGSNLPDHFFDFCIIANVLFMLECRGCIAAEAARILKPTGKVVLVDWLGSYGGLGPHPRHVVGKAEALADFAAHGFVPADDLPAGEYHWSCILKRQ